MKKIILALLCAISLFSCGEEASKSINNNDQDAAKEKEFITAMLDSFNLAAANADYNRYFSFFTANATFNGTDATENWTKEAFMIWAKPYFDKKTTWNFKALKRNIYFGLHPDIAWFDEILSTQMKICRGSGVIVKCNGHWKVQQYVLSMTIPNEKIKEVIHLKAPIEDTLIENFEK